MEYSIFLILFLLILSGFFAGIETAFLSLDLFFIEIKTEKKHKFSLIYHVLKKPHIIVTTILIGTNIALIATTQILSRYLNQNNLFDKIFLYFIFPIIMLIIAEIYPKILFSKISYTISKILVYPYFIFQIILSPIVFIFNLISKIFELLFSSKTTSLDKIQNEEIKNILASSLKNKISQANLYIEDAIKFDELKIYDIQKPIFSLPSLIFDENGKLDISILFENWEKNFAVYDEKNNFLGIINSDAVFNSEKIQKFFTLEEIPLLNNIPVIYEGKNLLNALELLNKSKSSILITIDEFGQRSGIITKVDLFSYISKTMVSKDDSYKYNIKKVGENTYIVPGFSELANLSRTIGINIEDDYYHTFNGYLIHTLGKIPKEGEVFIINNNLEIRVVSANKKFVEKAIVKITDTKKERSTK